MKRVYISNEAFAKLKEMTEENASLLRSNKGLKGMLDLLILGYSTSKGSGRK